LVRGPSRKKELEALRSGKVVHQTRDVVITQVRSACSPDLTSLFGK
jgi:hypothetical protein